MKYFSNKGYETLLVTDVRCSHFLKKNPELNSRIIRTDTPTNKNFIKKILSFIVIFFSVIKSILILRKEKPTLIFGFGGYVSFPILLAAQVLKKKIYLYEPNLVLGRTNKFFVNSCEKIFTNFPNSFSEHC